jgi:hypothetical protein
MMMMMMMMMLWSKHCHLIQKGRDTGFNRYICLQIEI